MTAMTFDSTVASDGQLHLAIPGTPPGTEVEVTVSPKSQPEGDKGWPADFHTRMFGCIEDDTFVRHPQPQLPTVATLD